MDYRQRPAPTTDAETYEFIKNWATRKTTSCRLVRCMSLLRTGSLPSVRRWRKHYRRRLPLFYVHRGMEKLAETRMGYNE